MRRASLLSAYAIYAVYAATPAFSQAPPDFDVFVSNAGIARHASLVNTTLAEFDAVNSTNWRGAYFATQAVAKAYRAACTPDFYLFDQDRHLVYRCQFDDSRPGNTILVTGKDLRGAIDALLAGKPAAPGCRTGA